MLTYQSVITLPYEIGHKTEPSFFETRSNKFTSTKNKLRYERISLSRFSHTTMLFLFSIVCCYFSLSNWFYAHRLFNFFFFFRSFNLDLWYALHSLSLRSYKHSERWWWFLLVHMHVSRGFIYGTQ